MERVKLLLLFPVLVLSSILGLIGHLWHVLVSPKFAWRVAIGFDQVVNATFKGSEDETISSRAGKGANKGIWHWCLLCKFLHFLDKHHCQNSIEADEGKPIQQ